MALLGFGVPEDCDVPMEAVVQMEAWLATSSVFWVFPSLTCECDWRLELVSSDVASDASKF